MLLLDGPPGTPFVWHRVLPVLRCCGVSAGTIKRSDYPGVAGRAGDPVAAAADVARLLDGHRRSPAVIVGHGVDVGVALTLAVIAQRHVRALVLVAPPAGLMSVSIVDRLLAAPVIGPVVTFLGFRLVGSALNLPALRRRILTERDRADAGDAKALVHEITFGAMWRDFVRVERRLVGEARRRNQQLAGIGCPVLVITGSRDRAMARRPDRRLRRLLPAAEVTAAIAIAGRDIPMEDPDCVADAVLRALRLEYRSSLSVRPSPSARRPS